MTKIMFVCHGNICRSPMAEFIFRKMIEEKNLSHKYIVSSSATSTEEIWNGIGNPVYPPAKAELKKRGFQMTDSVANFIFVRSDKIKGWDYYFSLKNEGVLVRHFSSDKIKDYVRITIGTKEQMDALLVATDKILGEV